MATNKAFYLAGTQGEGTRIWVAPVPCTLIYPQSGTFTVASGGADAADTSIPITAASFLTRPETTDPFLLFKDTTTGEETMVEVNGDITAGATSITLNAAIAVPGAVTAIPASSTVVFTVYPEILVKMNLLVHGYYSSATA